MTEKILTQFQLSLIQRELISRDHKRFFAIARYTGQNIRRICKLKVSDVYYDRHVPKPFMTFSGGKFKPHSFPIHEPLKNALLIYYPETFVSDAWLFPSKIIKGKPITPRAVSMFIESALIRAELEHLNVTTKMIRESFICELCKAGMSNTHIKEILGTVDIPGIVTRFSNEPIDFRVALENIFG